MTDPARFLAHALVRAALAHIKQIPLTGTGAELSSDAYQAARQVRLEAEQLDLSERVAGLEALPALQAGTLREIIEAEVEQQSARGATVPPDHAELWRRQFEQLPSAAGRATQTFTLARARNTPPEHALPLDESRFDEPQRNRFWLELLPLRPLSHTAGDPVPHRGGWRLDAFLGAGGFGEVWRAHHPLLGRTEAIKFCSAPNLQPAFRREAGTLASLYQQLPAHPNIVGVRDINVEQPPYWIAFELMPGGTLDGLIRSYGGRLPLGDALELFRQICDGVAAAHDHAVVHRDLKPHNVLLDADGALRIADFGLARIEADHHLRHTLQTATVDGRGTPLYMSPEQLTGQPAHPADDVYALAVLLFQMLVGDSERASTFLRHDLEQRQPPVPVRLVDVIERCLARPRYRRPANAGVLCGELGYVSRGDRQRLAQAMRCSANSLHLDWLTALDPDTAARLARRGNRDSGWIELHLNGLRVLDPETAAVLASWGGPNDGYFGAKLHLNGLQALNPNTAASLATWRCGELSLNGLHTLEPETAASLATWGAVDWRGFVSNRTLSLNGLQTLDPDIASRLATWGSGEFFGRRLSLI